MRRTMLSIALVLPAVFAASITLPARAVAQGCIGCHTETTPNIVADWKLSKHSGNDVECSVCHGDAHRTADDAEKALIPTPETCAQCHETQVG